MSVGNEFKMIESEFDKLPINKQVELVHKSATLDFNKALEDSGKSKVEFVMFDKDAIVMLYEWSEFQRLVKEDYGIDVPPIENGVAVSVNQ